MAPELRYGDRAVYLPDADSMVLADLHVGRDRTSNVELPLGERADLVERLEAALTQFDPGRVVIAGDYLHAFDRVPQGVRETVDEIETLVDRSGADLVVTPGNHDTALEHTSGATIQPTVRTGSSVIAHGHEEIDESADLTIVGHEHPAIEFGGRRRPCFLYGPDVRDGGDVVVVPAFTRLAAGSPVNRLRNGDVRSPVVTPVSEFRPYVHAEGELLEFPTIGTLRSVL